MIKVLLLKKEWALNSLQAKSYSMAIGSCRTFRQYLFDSLFKFKHIPRPLP